MPYWEVVGGADSAGIVVREGQDLKSNALGLRLATGAVILQVEQKGERVHYYLVMGSGPPEGWVSTKTKAGPLLRGRELTSEPWFLALKQFRAKKKDPAEQVRLLGELAVFKEAEENLPGGFTANGFIEAAGLAMGSHPDNLDLQLGCLRLLGNCCLFNEYACRKAGMSGAVAASIRLFLNNTHDVVVQRMLGDLGCFFDYDEENKQMFLSMGGIEHCYDMLRLHREDKEVVFSALAAVSTSVYPRRALEAGAAETLPRILSEHQDDKIRSEVLMVVKTLLAGFIPDESEEAARALGAAGICQKVVLAMREHLGSRPVQANAAASIMGLCREPGNVGILIEAGAVDALVAAVQEDTRCPGFCWGLKGMEDNLWPVLTQCSLAMVVLGHGRPEHLTAMVRAGAIAHLQAALQRGGQNDAAQGALATLEAHCASDAGARAQPREGFEGLWIPNSRPDSSGILRITPGEGGLLEVVLTRSGRADLDYRCSPAGGTLTCESPEGARGTQFLLREGKVYCGATDTVFYPWHAPEQ